LDDGQSLLLNPRFTELTLIDCPDRECIYFLILLKRFRGLINEEPTEKRRLKPTKTLLAVVFVARDPRSLTAPPSGRLQALLAALTIASLCVRALSVCVDERQRIDLPLIHYQKPTPDTAGMSDSIFSVA